MRWSSVEMALCPSAMHMSFASAVMKQMNSLTISCIRTFASRAIFASFGRWHAINLATLAIGVALGGAAEAQESEFIKFQASVSKLFYNAEIDMLQATTCDKFREALAAEEGLLAILEASGRPRSHVLDV